MPDHIYFVKSGDFIKIGTTIDIAGRMRDLAHGNPHGLELLATAPGDRDVELAIHKKLGEFRKHREWFLDCKPVRDLMQDFLAIGVAAVSEFYVERCRYSAPMPTGPRVNRLFVEQEAADLDRRWDSVFSRSRRIFDALRSAEMSALRIVERESRSEKGSLTQGLFPGVTAFSLDQYRALSRAVIDETDRILALSEASSLTEASRPACQNAEAILDDLEKQIGAVLGVAFEAL